MNQIQAFMPPHVPHDGQSVDTTLAWLDKLGMFSSRSYTSEESNMTEASVRQLAGCPANTSLRQIGWVHVEVTSTQSAVATVCGYQCTKRNILSRLFVQRDLPYAVKKVSYHDTRQRDLNTCLDVHLMDDMIKLVRSLSSHPNNKTLNEKLYEMRVRIDRCSFIRFADTLTFTSIIKLSEEEAYLQMLFGEQEHVENVYVCNLYKTKGVIKIRHHNHPVRHVTTLQQARADSKPASVAFDILMTWRSTDRLVIGGVLHC